MTSKYFPEIIDFINQLSPNKISAQRRSVLEMVADDIRQYRVENKGPLHLIFICTHNSRRSIIAEVLAALFLDFFKITNAESHSGGTMSTEVNIRVLRALRAIGFHVSSKEGLNPECQIQWGWLDATKFCWSTPFMDESNPKEGFYAMMVCHHADQHCPFVPGAFKRFSIPYTDPKHADDSIHEKQTYMDKCYEIGCEMKYLFSLLS